MAAGDYYVDENGDYYVNDDGDYMVVAQGGDCCCDGDDPDGLPCDIGFEPPLTASVTVAAVDLQCPHDKCSNLDGSYTLDLTQNSGEIIAYRLVHPSFWDSGCGNASARVLGLSINCFTGLVSVGFQSDLGTVAIANDTFNPIPRSASLTPDNDPPKWCQFTSASYSL